MRELETLYLQGRERLTALLRDRDDHAAAAVPACPDWSVKDVLSHLTGVCADILTGNVAASATDGWTAAQVEARRPLPLGDVLSEWGDAGPKLASLLDDFPGWYGTQVVADVTVHECDVLGAFGMRPVTVVPAATIERCLDFVLSAIVDPGATALGVGPVEFVAGGRSWTVGGPAPAGEPDAAIRDALAGGHRPSPPDREPVAQVRAEPFELLRALTGRRSAEQVRAFDWAGDADAWLPLFGLWPFTLRETELAV